MRKAPIMTIGDELDRMMGHNSTPKETLRDISLHTARNP